jgi:hypothetical protein
VDLQCGEPENVGRNEAGQTQAETDANSGSTRREPVIWNWKDYQSAAEPIGGDGIPFDRLTQFLASAHSRRRIGGMAAAVLAGRGVHLPADIALGNRKKRKKKKKKRNRNPGETCTPACGDGFACNNGVCACASNVICDDSCCAAGDVCLAGDCCPDDQACVGVCCPDGNSCVRNECCSNSRECGTTCCEGSEICANIVPGGIKGCCENTLTIRGETCCPTGSLSTRLNCGSYQCKYALSGTGPGGCDLWCRVGAGGEGAYCARDIEGIPVPEDPDVECCCTAGQPVACVYPVPNPI